jgi:sulfur-carrier protein
VITVKVHTILEFKRITGQREFEVSLPPDSTVKDLLAWMTEKWGEWLSSRLFEGEESGPFPHVRLMVNGRPIEFLDGVNTILHHGDEFLLLPLAAGG